MSNYSDDGWGSPAATAKRVITGDGIGNSAAEGKKEHSVNGQKTFGAIGFANAGRQERKEASLDGLNNTVTNPYRTSVMHERMEPSCNGQNNCGAIPSAISNTKQVVNSPYVQSTPVAVAQSKYFDHTLAVSTMTAAYSNGVPSLPSTREQSPNISTAFPKQSTNPSINGLEVQTDVSLAYVTKLAKIYADFGQSLVDLHKEFIGHH